MHKGVQRGMGGDDVSNPSPSQGVTEHRWLTWINKGEWL